MCKQRSADTNGMPGSLSARDSPYALGKPGTIGTYGARQSGGQFM